MTVIQNNLNPEDVRQEAKHVLFVEGNDDSALDPRVLSELLPMIRVNPLGASYNVRSAAETFFKYHPNYYFLIDCDHYGDEFVDRCWAQFRDPDTSNLLVWRRRELENYFLMPEYLLHSSFLRVSETKLRDCIVKHCKRRLYLDCINQVIVEIREEFKETWIEAFKNPAEFTSYDTALDKLKNVPQFLEYSSKVSKKIEIPYLVDRFNSILKKFTNDRDVLEFDQGCWLEMISGKQVLNAVVTECFHVNDAQGNPVQGRECCAEVVKELLRQNRSFQPEDFQRLFDLIQTRIANG